MTEKVIETFWSKVIRITEGIPVIIIRSSVGVIFLSEGIQKFLFSDSVGAGRFAKIGLPAPDDLAAFVGGTEILCGVFILIGLLTRLAAIPLVMVMLTAIITTKIPILLESGFWKMAHDSRTDYSMLMSLCFLIIVGSGHLSVDKYLWGRKAN